MKKQKVKGAFGNKNVKVKKLGMDDIIIGLGFASKQKPSIPVLLEPSGNEISVREFLIECKKNDTKQLAMVRIAPLMLTFDYKLTSKMAHNGYTYSTYESINEDRFSAMFIDKVAILTLDI